jgi:PAS domain S-box-containing protein
MQNDFESVFGFIQNSVYVYDLTKGVIKYVNNHYNETFGYSLQELNSIPCEAYIKLFHPDDHETITKHISEVKNLKKGEVKTIEYRIKSKNNGWLWCLSKDTGYEYDDMGEMQSYVGSILDITKQKQTEDALKEITHSYQELVENAPFGMHFYTLNDKGHLIFKGANPAADCILGIDNSQFIGKTIGEAFPPLLQTEIPQRYHDVAAKGIPWETEQIAYEDEKITGAFEVKAFQTKSGSMVAIYGDITERIKTQDTKQKSEELYRLLADTSTDMIARHNEAGVFLYVSPSCKTLLGYEPEDLIGHSAFDFFHPDDLAELEKNRKRIIEQPINTTVTFRFRKKNGDYTWFETNTHTIFDKKTSAVIELHASSRDVTERINSRQQIQHQNNKLKELIASKDKFFSLLSHDLRGPLNTICQLLNILNENISKSEIDERNSRYVSIISDSANNLASLVDDVLMWANSQSGGIPFNLKEINSSNIIKETLNIVKTTATAKNISINVNDNNSLLVADSNMLKTILRNLISNAIKFTYRGGHIEIKVDQDEDKTTIAVIDDGIGMRLEEKEKLFDISEFMSKPGTENEKGTGIGLIICKEFIDKHNGSIWIDSKLGKGSTFTFEIPLHIKQHL